MRGLIVGISGESGASLQPLKCSSSKVVITWVVELVSTPSVVRSMLRELVFWVRCSILRNEAILDGLVRVEEKVFQDLYLVRVMRVLWVFLASLYCSQLDSDGDLVAL